MSTPLFVLASIVTISAGFGWLMILLVPILLASAGTVFGIWGASRFSRAVVLELTQMRIMMRLPFVNQTGRVTIYSYDQLGRKVDRLGPKLEKRLYLDLQKALPGARASGCIHHRSDSIEAHLRIWSLDGRSSIIETRSPSLGGLIHKIDQMLMTVDQERWGRPARHRDEILADEISCPLLPTKSRRPVATV